MSIFLISCFFWVPTRRQFVTWISLSNYNEVIIITISRLEKPSLFLFLFCSKWLFLWVQNFDNILKKHIQNFNESHTREKHFCSFLRFWIFYIELLLWLLKTGEKRRYADQIMHLNCKIHQWYIVEVIVKKYFLF